MSKIELTLSEKAYVPVHAALKDTDTNYLEIGVFNGLGFVEVARAFPDRKCHGIDPFIEDGNTYGQSQVGAGAAMPAQQASAIAYIEEQSNAELYVMTSHAFRETLTEELIDALNIGVVLIDGNHGYPFVTNDYNLALEVLGKKGGTIVWDDLHLPGVAQAHKEFTQTHADRISTNVTGEVDNYIARTVIKPIE